MVLPGGVQALGLLPTAAPGVFVGRVSQGRARRASQTAWVTSSVTATSLRGGARVMKTEEATLFSCLEAMISFCGAEILIPTGRQGPKFRPAPRLSCTPGLCATSCCCFQLGYCPGSKSPAPAWISVAPIGRCQTSCLKLKEARFPEHSFSNVLVGTVGL